MKTVSSQRKDPVLPLVVFIGFLLAMAVFALILASRNGTGPADTAIKAIAGWAALILAIFGPFGVFVSAWMYAPKAYQKELGIVYLILGVLTTAILVFHVLRWIF
ncbi:MAG: hypothetical protein Q7S89_03275 [bacterium]|nr:hypothetical protein [bacterium]